jgi:hypothetical protein
MAEFKAYTLRQKKSHDASIDEVEALRKKHESLMAQLSKAEDKVREQNRMKVNECFAVTKLTEELLDEYVESVEVHPGNEVRISWK